MIVNVNQGNYHVKELIGRNEILLTGGVEHPLEESTIFDGCLPVEIHRQRKLDTGAQTSRLNGVINITLGQANSLSQRMTMRKRPLFDNSHMEIGSEITEAQENLGLGTTSHLHPAISRCKSDGDLIETIPKQLSPDAKSENGVVESNFSKTRSLSESLAEWKAGFFLSKPKTEDKQECDLYKLPTDGDESTNGDASTTGYFDAQDFVSSNWKHAVDIIPPVGFAVVASGIMLFHPFLFVAGAITAFGTMHAMGATQDYCFDGSLFHVFTGGEAATEAPKNANDTSAAEPVSEVTFALSEDDETTERTVLKFGEQSSMLSTIPESASIFRKNPSALDAQDSLKWVEHHYPTLSNTAVENVELAGLNAIEFFRVFFANDAPYTYEEFQKKRNDKDIQYGCWEKLDHVQQPSLHPHALSCTDLSLRFQERILKFHAKTNTYFGPPYAPTTKVQRCLIASKRLVVLESKTTVTDIPFSDRFHVMERWVVTAEKRDNRYVSLLSIHSEAFFTKKCPFESKIKSTSKETVLEIAKQWCEMAQEALKLTEAHRVKRIRDESLTDIVGDDDSSLGVQQQNCYPSEQDLAAGCDFTAEDYESIEVKHSGSQKSWVIGEEQDENLSCTDEKYGAFVGNRKRGSSIGRMGRSLSNLVRKRHAKSEDFKVQ